MLGRLSSVHHRTADCATYLLRKSSTVVLPSFRLRPWIHPDPLLRVHTDAMLTRIPTRIIAAKCFCVESTSMNTDPKAAGSTDTENFGQEAAACDTGNTERSSTSAVFSDFGNTWNNH